MSEIRDQQKKKEKPAEKDLFEIENLEQELKLSPERVETKPAKKPCPHPIPTKQEEEDPLGVSQEIDLLMRSIVQVEKEKNVEAIYDRYVQSGKKEETKRASQDLKPLKGVHVEKQYVEKRKEEGAFEGQPNEEPPLRKSKRKFSAAVEDSYENEQSIAEYHMSWSTRILLVLACFSFVGILYASWGIFNSPTSEHKDPKSLSEKDPQVVSSAVSKTPVATPLPPTPTPKEKAPTQQPLPLARQTPQPKEMVQKMPQNDFAPTLSTPLKKFLQKFPEESEVASTLSTLSNNNELKPEDIVLLQKIYGDYPDNAQLKATCLWAAGVIQGEKAREWLKTTFAQTSSSMEKVSIIEALEKFGDAVSKDMILEIFRQEQQENIALSCVGALVKLAPDDENVYQKLTGKFHETQSENLRSMVLHVVSTMNVRELSSFLADVVRNAAFSQELRFRALEALTNHARNHPQGTSVQALQNLYSSIQDEQIQEAIRAALDDMSQQE